MRLTDLSEKVTQEADCRWAAVVAAVIEDVSDPKRFWYFDPIRLDVVTVRLKLPAADLYSHTRTHKLEKPS